MLLYVFVLCCPAYQFKSLFSDNFILLNSMNATHCPII